MPPDDASRLLSNHLFVKGLSEFNRQDFFQCHETLEELWKTLSGDERELTQGIIQIAVGYHHLLKDNRTGALKLLKRGLERVERAGAAGDFLEPGGFLKKVAASIATIESGDSFKSSELPVIEFLSN